MLYDSESLSMSSTYYALRRAMKYKLVDRVGASPCLWIPTGTAYDMRSELENRFLTDTADV